MLVGSRISSAEIKSSAAGERNPVKGFEERLQMLETAEKTLHLLRPTD